MSLFLFECKKLFKKKQIWAGILLSIVAFVSLYLFNYSLAERMHQETTVLMQKDLDEYPIHMEKLEEEKKIAEQNGDLETLAEYPFHKNYGDKVYKNTKQWMEGYEEENWKELHQIEIDELQLRLDEDIETLEGGGDIGVEHRAIFFTRRATLVELKLLAADDLKPFVQRKRFVEKTPYIRTVYDDFKGRELEKWEQETRRYATTGFSFLYQFVQYLGIPVLILVGCLLFGNTASSEMSRKKRGLHFYYALPIQRSRVFFIKYISGLLSTLLFVMCMLVVPLVASLFVGGIGSMKYPVLMYEGFPLAENRLKQMEDTFHFIMFQEYIGKVLLLAIGITILVYSLYYVLALILKNPSIVVIVTALLTFGGMKLATSPYNPFTYVDMHKIINNEVAALTFTKAINLQNGMIVCLVLACLLFGLGYVRFKKVKI